MEEQKKISKMKKVVLGVAGVVLVICAIAGFLYWQNNDIVTTSYEYSSDKVTDKMDGFSIVVISDLHTKVFGDNNDVLLEKVSKCKPDAIFLTGDYIDCTEFDKAVELAGKLTEMADTYYVTGNHETSIENSQWEKINEFEEEMIDKGVKVLDSVANKIEDNVYIIGLTDRD